MTIPSSASYPGSSLEGSFQRSYQQLLRFLARKTGCAEDARDLAQDLWLQLQTRQSPAADDPQAYLFAMARNLAIDHLRRRRLADEHAESWLALHPQEQACIDTPQLLAQRKVLEAVSATLAALPERTREVFLQFRVHGVGQDELASRHGVTRSTIERDVMRAGRAVEGVLAHWHGSAGPQALDGRRRRQLIGSLLGAAGMAGSGALVWSWWREHVAQWQAVLASAVGRTGTHELPDGSRVMLDAASRLGVAYYAARRHARLEAGSAFFDVAHAPQRPFTVEAGGARITVLGTCFSVDLRPGGDGGVVDVAVESGRVRVEPLAAGVSWAPRELAAGETWRLVPGQAAQASPVLSGEAVAQWRDGWLGFRDAPLGEVVERLRRYTGADIAITEGAARLPVTAQIRIARAGTWLRMLPDAMPVRVQARDGGGRIDISERM